MTQVDPRFYDEILPRLWRGGKWGYYWSNDDGEGNKVTVWKNLEENSSPPVTPAWLGKMNCYYGIHPTKQRGESSWARAKIADIACINCLYAEIDGIESDEREAEWIHWLLNDCAVRPSLIIFSGAFLLYVLDKLRDTLFDLFEEIGFLWFPIANSDNLAIASRLVVDCASDAQDACKIMH